MPTLTKHSYTAEITWLGHVPAGGSLRAEKVDRLDLGLGGIAGGRHEGKTRPSCSRVLDLYPRGTEIANVRQLTILSGEELDQIAGAMGVETLDPAFLGATIVLRGIPDFSHVPPSSRLQSASGATMTVDLENLPCVFPGKEIEADMPGLGAKFKPAAKGLRGVTAWVERPGELKVGDQLQLFVPTQPAWQG